MSNTSTPLRRFWAEFLENKPAVVALVVVIALILLALSAFRFGRAKGGPGKIGILRGHQRPDQLRLALPQQRDDHQCKQDRRERQLQIDKTHDQRLDPAPDIGCKNAKGRADGQRDKARSKPDLN